MLDIFRAPSLKAFRASHLTSCRPPYVKAVGRGSCHGILPLLVHGDRLRVGCGEVPRGEKMLYSGTDQESYITEYTLVYEDKRIDFSEIEPFKR